MACLDIHFPGTYVRTRCGKNANAESLRDQHPCEVPPMSDHLARRLQGGGTAQCRFHRKTLPEEDWVDMDASKASWHTWPNISVLRPTLSMGLL